MGHSEARSERAGDRKWCDEMRGLGKLNGLSVPWLRIDSKSGNDADTRGCVRECLIGKRTLLGPNTSLILIALHLSQ